MRSETVSVEAKYTDAKQFVLKNEDLIKAERYALIDGRDSVFVVSFSGRDEWAIIRQEDFLALQQKADELAELRRSYNDLAHQHVLAMKAPTW